MLHWCRLFVKLALPIILVHVFQLWLIAGLEKALRTVADAFQAVEAMHEWKDELVAEKATFDDALYVQTVIDSIKESNKSKRWVNVNILDEEPDPNPHLSIVVRRNAFATY